MDGVVIGVTAVTPAKPHTMLMAAAKVSKHAFK